MEQDELSLKMADRFYGYNSVISPSHLIRKYAADDVKPTYPYLTNALGVKVDPKFSPEILKGREGEIEPLPIPASWHADMAEFGAVLRAVDLARETFTIIELGCGWGCWMNNAGVAAKKRGLAVKLIGVEGDPGHVAFAQEALTANGFDPREYVVYHGIVASRPGNALFPLQEHSGESFGLEPLFDVSDAESAELVRAGRHVLLQQYTLEDLARDVERVDLLHVDIQGGEETLIPSTIAFLTERVAYLYIGTHSRPIEGAMYSCMLKAGWVLEIERPAIVTPGSHPTTVIDGVQGWRNPKLLPTVDIAEPCGSLTMTSGTHRVRVDEEVSVRVTISNQSTTDWLSVGHTPVMASYQWIDPNGSVAPVEGLRTRLEGGVISAGETKSQSLRVRAPSTPGTYGLSLTLVQEGIRWFEQPEFSPATVSVTVASPREQ